MNSINCIKLIKKFYIFERSKRSIALIKPFAFYLSLKSILQYLVVQDTWSHP